MNKRPFNVLGIEHVGIAVKNLEGISYIFSDILGLDLIGREDVQDQQVLTEIYNIGEMPLDINRNNPNTPSDEPEIGSENISTLIEKK